MRDIEHRLAVLLRKQCGPSENGGPATAAEIIEEAKLRVVISDKAQALVCPAGYGPGDALNDSNRLHQLHCKHFSPSSCGGGELKGAEDEEEAFLTARIAAFRYSQEGSDRQRITELEVWRQCRSKGEQAELPTKKRINAARECAT